MRNDLKKFCKDAFLIGDRKVKMAKFRHWKKTLIRL